MIDLRTIKGVELIRVGTWEISTGTWEVTRETIASAIAAHQAGIVRKPALKIGHDDDRFTDGDPAIGYVDNLRASADGTTLFGDYVDVPALLAKLTPRAYPDRSVEGIQNYRDSTGKRWPFVLTACALLGATTPGIPELNSLRSVASLYGLAAAGRVVAARFTPVTEDHRLAVTVAAARRRRTLSRKD